MEAGRLMPVQSRILLDIRNLSMRYASGKVALNGVDLAVEAGEVVIVLGSNGSGKSSLLRCISRLQDPTGGEIKVAGNDLARLNGNELRRARMAVAMIFQHANLVRRRSVIANVCAGALGHHRTLATALGFLPRGELDRAIGYLTEVGLEHLADQRAGTLSGGQAQRVAISRALAQRPQVVLADEPVASLDPQAAEEVMVLLRRLATEDDMAVLCVLHQPELAARYADRIVGIQDGTVAFDLPALQVSTRHVASLYDRKAA
jgi:phosphonate transport system ATP-binding protein